MFVTGNFFFYFIHWYPYTIIEWNVLTLVYFNSYKITEEKRVTVLYC